MKDQSAIRQNTISAIGAGEYRSKALEAIKTANDDQPVTFSNLVVQYDAEANGIMITFDLQANNENDEIWSVSPMVMTDSQPVYAISQIMMGGNDGYIPFGASLSFRNNTMFPVTDAIKGQTVQVGIAGFIWSEDNPWGLFSSETINLQIPA